MTTKEFSLEFDILYNNIMSGQAPGINEYEKSVFLTIAQEAFVVELYTGRNASGDSFESTEEYRRYLADLLKTVTLTDSNFSTATEGLSPDSVKVTIPENLDLLFIVQEQAMIKDSLDNCLKSGKWVNTFPIKRDEYNDLKDNPFKNNKVWRNDLSENEVELISKKDIDKYKVTFLQKPSPIILEDLANIESAEGLDSGFLSINGERELAECKLNTAIHRDILNRAVMFAKTAYTDAVVAQQEE